MCAKGGKWAWSCTLGVPPAAFPRFFLSAFSFSSISIISLSINVIKVLHRLWSSYNYKHIKPTPTKSLLSLLLLLFNVAKCNLGKVNLESMRPAVFLTNMHAGWPQGFALPYADESAICSSFAIITVCSTLFRWQIYYPALPTHVGSHNQVSTVLGKYFHRSSFSVTVVVGGHWQGWFPLTGSPCKPSCCASYLHGAPTNLSWQCFSSFQRKAPLNVANCNLG